MVHLESRFVVCQVVLARPDFAWVHPESALTLAPVNAVLAAQAVGAEHRRAKTIAASRLLPEPAIIHRIAAKRIVCAIFYLGKVHTALAAAKKVDLRGLRETEGRVVASLTSLER